MGHINKTNESFNIINDGTNTIISFRGTRLFRFRNSDKQLQVEGGIDTDTSL